MTKAIKSSIEGVVLDGCKCGECGWKGPISECEVDQEGNWEYGYYDIHLCPKCDDGTIDDYFPLSLMDL